MIVHRMRPVVFVSRIESWRPVDGKKVSCFIEKIFFVKRFIIGRTKEQIGNIEENNFG